MVDGAVVAIVPKSLTAWCCSRVGGACDPRDVLGRGFHVCHWNGFLSNQRDGRPKAPSCGGSPREGARSEFYQLAEQRLAAGGRRLPRPGCVVETHSESTDN